MRISYLLLFTALTAACDRVEAPGFTLQVGKVERVDGCHVLLTNAGGTHSIHAEIRFACGVSSSALTEERWWGDRKPEVIGVAFGDCLRFETLVYCVEDIKLGKSASFKATYRKKHNGDLIERIE
jgi:hypothetical protein